MGGMEWLLEIALTALLAPRCFTRCGWSARSAC